MSKTNCVKFFFGRFQPPHMGHFRIIKEAVEDNPNNCAIYVFISPKKSIDDIQRGTYGVYEEEDRYPLTPSVRLNIMQKELSDMGLGNVEVRTDARTAQLAIKKIIAETGIDPENITLMIGEDRKDAFTRSFRNPRDDGNPHPERDVNIESFGRNEADISATEIRNKLIPLIHDSISDTDRILRAIRSDPYLNENMPSNEDSRRQIINDYEKKMMALHKNPRFGSFSAFAIHGGRKRQSKRKKIRKTKRRRNKVKKTRRVRRKNKTKRK